MGLLKMHILGVDIGKKGGISLIDMSGAIVDMKQMPEAFDLAKILSGVKGQILRAYVEKAQSMPGQGGVFNYGTGFGKVLGVLEALQISYDLVPPQRWQKKLLGKFDKGTSKKAAYVRAKQLWPKESFVLKGCRKPHDGIVDACLIAEFGRLHHL